MRSSSKRLPGARRQAIFALSALVALLAVLATASSALATPKGEFAIFADCPVTTVDGCIYAKTESGAFTIGKETVPIVSPVILQGGFTENAKGEQSFVGAKDGNTLSKTPQKVPGGLAGLVKCNEISNFFERLACELLFENGVTGVNATVELAAPASSIGLNEFNFLVQSGPALTLPVKVHLENPFLGSECYIGSNSKPISIALTTGTSGTVKGTPGKEEFIAEGLILRFSKNSLVNGTFAAPEVSGCAGGLLNSVVDSKLGLPSASGKNTAVLNGTLSQAGSEIVKEHE
jgi:hypothetical protein